MLSSTPSLADLVRRIQSTHHVRTRVLLDELALFIQAERATPTAADPSLARDAITALRRTFAHFRADLMAHLRTEEIAVFPYIVALHEAAELGRSPRRALFNSVASPIQIMRNEQEGTQRALRRLSRAIDIARIAGPEALDFPAVTAAVSELASDLEAHVRIERDVLFPRAVEVERALAAYLRA